MQRPRVLLDTNTLISGLVFTKGNEHGILRLVEDKRITLVLSETVLIEAKKVLEEKFLGFEELLDVFLNRINFEEVRIIKIQSRMANDSGKVRDKKDVPIYSAVAFSKPDYVISGDGTLRQDLANSSEISDNTIVYSSREFLRNFPA